MAHELLRGSMTDPVRLSSVILRTLAAAVIAYEGVVLVGQALIVGLVPGAERASAFMVGPILVISGAALVYRRSRALGEWITRGA